MLEPFAEAAPAADTLKGFPSAKASTIWPAINDQAGLACGHILPTVPWFTDVDLPRGGTGARNRRFPTGGSAYLIFEKL